MKRNSAFIDDPQRCEICSTTLTLYPKDFAPCPHCQRSICRQCWGAVWSTKNFPAEACAHLMENDGLTITPVGEKKQGFSWDWQKIIFITALIVLAVGTAVFLFNLFVS
jgi:hypothetical protein